MLAGLVVALALIPEAVAFSIIAGVDPKVGLYASFSIAVITSILGGRPGMISAATAATAVLMVTLVKDHGLQYLLATTVLVGILQILAGILKLGSLMRFVSRSVMIGFVNALAILIFLAQLPELTNVPKLTYLMVAGGLLLIYVAPRFVKFIPSPLICIVVLTCLSILFDLDVRTVDDMGELPASLPLFLLPDIPITLETFLIIFPYSAAIASVGLLESLMTATIIDDLTDTSSDKNRECVGQGIANCATGFIGGMAGCAMIGQSVINIKSGGRGRLSSLCAGVFLLILCVGLGDWVRQIPMAALVSVMIMVSISTFNWSSIKNLKTKHMPKQLTYRQLSENFIKSKSEKDYGALYQRVKPGLRNYIRNVVKDNEATEDILTNTLTKMWTKIDQYDPKYQITTWLYRIAFNECLGWIRQRNTKYSLDAMKEYGIEVAEQYGHHTSARDLLIETEMKTEQDWYDEDDALTTRYELALKNISILKPMYRVIIEDRLINNMKYEDIATKHKLPLQTIKNRIRRGKAIIAEQMGY